MTTDISAAINAFTPKELAGYKAYSPADRRPTDAVCPAWEATGLDTPDAVAAVGDLLTRASELHAAGKAVVGDADAQRHAVVLALAAGEMTDDDAAAALAHAETTATATAALRTSYSTAATAAAAAARKVIIDAGESLLPQLDAEVKRVHARVRELAPEVKGITGDADAFQRGGRAEEAWRELHKLRDSLSAAYAAYSALAPFLPEVAQKDSDEADARLFRLERHGSAHHGLSNGLVTHPKDAEATSNAVRLMVDNAQHPDCAPGVHTASEARALCDQHNERLRDERRAEQDANGNRFV
ncbi:hypothetical protein GCM10023224_40770 [Streptomonospora halophila]|uniref:DUF222 domain-containing protein n=1 Tax=Streptomonospora halophila TaxID=427369 RepID=A0ABP9GS49_9ACTN